MTKENIIIGNKLIAEFMGAEIKDDTYCFHLGNPVHDIQIEDMTFESVLRLRYNCSWDWIMSTWEKIMSLNKNKFEFDEVRVGRQSIFIKLYIWDNLWVSDNFLHACYEDGDCKDMKEVYYKTIVDFIKWYKKNI